MNIRKKDIRLLCDSISAVSGPFVFSSPEGKTLYVTEGYCPSVADKLHDIIVDGAMAGSVAVPGSRGEAVAGLVGLFLKNVEERRTLTEHTLQKYREMSFLSGINKVLGSSADIREVLSSVTKTVHEIIEIDACSVMVPDERTGKFVLKAISGRAVNEPLALAINEGIAGKVIASGRSVIVNDPEQHPDFARTGTVEIKSLLCLPLIVKDQTTGLLTLRNKKSGMFTSEDEALIASMCVMVAEVIENARLLEEKIKNEKFSAIGQMAAGIIHDIKNPMTTIKGFAGLLGDLDFTKEERKEYSSMIVGEVDRLVNMVEDLLAFARGFKSKLSFETVNAQEYLSEVVQFIRKDMEVRGIEVSLKMDYTGTMFLDREKFKRVIFNIAGNAREALHDGGRFLICIRPAENGLEIICADSGSGIPEEILESLFEPFVTKGKKSGTGLGLAISKKIIEEHGGSIKAVNGDYCGAGGHCGANFVIMLPYPDGAPAGQDRVIPGG